MKVMLSLLHSEIRCGNKAGLQASTGFCRKMLVSLNCMRFYYTSCHAPRQCKPMRWGALEKRTHVIYSTGFALRATCKHIQGTSSAYTRFGHPMWQWPLSFTSLLSIVANYDMDTPHAAIPNGIVVRREEWSDWVEYELRNRQQILEWPQKMKQSLYMKYKTPMPNCQMAVSHELTWTHRKVSNCLPTVTWHCVRARFHNQVSSIFFVVFIIFHHIFSFSHILKPH